MEGTSAVIQFMERVSELKYYPDLMMLDLLCVYALHIALPVWRWGSAMLGSLLKSIEVLNLYKDSGYTRSICMLWVLTEHIFMLSLMLKG